MTRLAPLLLLVGTLALGGCSATSPPGEQRPDNGLARIVTDARDAPGSLAPVGPSSSPGTNIALPTAPSVPTAPSGPTVRQWRHAADPICRRLNRARAKGNRTLVAQYFGQLARVSVPPQHLGRWITFLNAEAQRSASITPPGLPASAKRFFAQRRKAARAKSRAALRGFHFKRCGH
jgi:hypothetical protein